MPDSSRHGLKLACQLLSADASVLKLCSNTFINAIKYFPKLMIPRVVSNAPTAKLRALPVSLPISVLKGISTGIPQPAQRTVGTASRHLVHPSLRPRINPKAAFFRYACRMPESRSNAPLVWIDCEMTGLDLSKDTIMSLACFITDAQLNLLDDTGYECVLQHTQEQLDAMGEWCQNHHGASGLTQACLNSTTTAETAATELLEYIQKFVPDRKQGLLAGNTVHADKAFLVQEPWRKVIRHLHHRILDVSAIKEAARRWAPEDSLKKSPQKKGKHEAKADILESIEEARYYRRVFFLGDREESTGS
ncbi:hypothetical protein D0869_00808 [Hortaea werneckii]|uniref:Exonuclease domain-containing protein n=1 Tax=Hortaea werneckii TaxID=91943 RepID=A0A3M6XGD2_HORWE|nr:hypothetical protein D0869_00808 [Hortaea werneckii]